jgi:hypothetical protein
MCQSSAVLSFLRIWDERLNGHADELGFGIADHPCGSRVPEHDATRLRGEITRRSSFVSGSA